MAWNSLSALLMPLGLLGSRVLRQPWADRLSWVGLLLLGLFSSLLVLTVLRDVLLLAAWASRHGTFFVTGNHEYYSGAHAWIVELRRLGLTVLMNEHVVLLAHQPRSAAAAALAGFDLQLSGHTHGGQFWPRNLLVPLQQPFTAGLNQ
eukprot:gene54351-72631_t